MLYKYIYTIAIGGNTDSDLNFQIQIVLQSPTISYHLSKIENIIQLYANPAYVGKFLLPVYISNLVYVTGFVKTDLIATFSISRNTDLKY